tara:strand:- start:1398 stop:1613 length:216 start_codon:yes stop_codon:yes gene_type:complete
MTNKNKNKDKNHKNIDSLDDGKCLGLYLEELMAIDFSKYPHKKNGHLTKKGAQMFRRDIILVKTLKENTLH